MNRFSPHLLIINVLFILALVMLASSVMMAYRQMQRLVDSENWVVHTYQVIEKLNETIISLNSAEDQARDFMVSHDKNHLIIFQDFGGIINISLVQLGNLVKDNPKELARLRNLSTLIKNKFGVLQQAIAIDQKKGEQAAFKMLLSEDQAVTEPIRQVVASMNQEELSLLAKREQASHYNTQESNLMMIITGILGAILLLLSFLLLNYYLKERKRAEREREELESRLKIIIDSSSDLIAALDLNYTFIAFNTAYKDKFKEFFDKKIKVGGNLKEILVDHPDKNKIIEVWRRALLGEEFTIVRKFKTLKKKNQYYEATYSTIRDVDNHLFGASQIMRDITERKRVEQLKNEFVSVVSHELRTPLTSIRGSVGLVLGGMVGTVDEKVKNMLTIAYNNCERLSHLINDILDIDRIESDKADFQFHVIDLVKLAEDTIDANQSFSQKFDVRLILNKPSSVIYVKTDYHRLMQVLTNLISNAVKFSPMGSKVEVTVEKRDGNAKVSVTDYGPGISEEFQKHIFEKFSQADSSVIRKQGGSGLGLNISQAIMQKLGGKLNYITKENVGSTFYFELPITQEALSGQVTDLEGYAVKNRLKVLYIEDDVELSEIISKILYNVAQVVCVETVQQAAKELNKQKFDVVLLDLVLNDGDSIEILPNLRKLGIPIVVFTAYELPEKYAPYVKKVLIKSKTTNKNLIDAIHAAVGKKQTTT